MKVQDLKTDELIVVVDEAGFERAYLVDHVGYEKISVTLLAGRSAGTTEWTTAFAEQQITLKDNLDNGPVGPWWTVKAPRRAVGRLIRAMVASIRDARARLSDRTMERDAARAALDAPTPPYKVPMSTHYDSDSTLPLGWSWRNVPWPMLDGGTIELPTAVGPNGEMVAKWPGRQRWYKVGITDRHDKIWSALEKAIVAAEQVRAKG